MHPKNNASQPVEDLILVDLPNGECAWLRPEQHHPLRVVDDGQSPAEGRAGITELGRDYLACERAFEALFGTWPTVAEARGLTKRDHMT
jgi:hypothetical protein